ncbi:MAG TPA: hypothetical protein VFQ68_02995 [Streptosporangiaceae bacterium]|nr:hypothetical protein [Streptosporangiaceae bacterium]
MTRVRKTSLAVLLATVLGITGLIAGLTTGTAFASTGLAQPAGQSLNLHHVKWGDVAVPGRLCRVGHPIQLHNGHARLKHSGFGPLDVSETGPSYGNLGAGQQVAALQVWCSNQGGTAAGELAEGLVVFSGAGGRLHVLGTLTPQFRPHAGHVHIPFVAVKSIGGERVVTTEFFYTGSDADCCPSGRALTSWHWNGHSFKPGRTVITRP